MWEPGHWNASGLHVLDSGNIRKGEKASRLLVLLLEKKNQRICSSGERQQRHLLHFWSSSEPSPQSSEPSHTQREEMQRWLAHSNWLDVQNLSAKRIQFRQTASQVFHAEGEAGRETEGVFPGRD